MRAARRRALHTFADFRGGVDLEGADYLIEGNRARDSLNIEPEGNGWRLRLPNDFLASPTGSYDSDFQQQVLGALDSPTTKRLVTMGLDAAGTTMLIRSMTVAGGSVTNINGAPIALSLTRYSIFQAPTVSSQGPLFGANKNGGQWEWGGSGNIAAWSASAGTLPTADHGLYHANRVWLANGKEGASEFAHRVWWSNLADPRNWSRTTPNDSGFVDLDPDDAEGITGLGVVGNYVLAFKRHKTWVIYDTDTGANRKLSESIGVLSHTAIAPSPHGTFFLGEDGIYVTDGSSIRKISQALEPLFPLQIDDVFYYNAVFHEDSLFVSLGSVGVGDVWQYHVPTQSWWRHTLDNTGSAGIDMVTGMVELDGNHYALGGSSVPEVYEFRSNQIAPENTVWEWAGPWHALGNPLVMKVVNEIRLDVDTGSGGIDVLIARWPTDSDAALTEIEWEAIGNGTSERRLYTPGRARLLALRLEGLNSEVRMGSYVIDATQKVNG